LQKRKDTNRTDYYFFHSSHSMVRKPNPQIAKCQTQIQPDE